MSELQTATAISGSRPYPFGVTDAPAPAGVPLLEDGDHLTRAEFERRYDAMPELKKAELIKGVVYMASPVRHRRHAKPHRRIVTWLGNYCDATAGVDAGDNGTVRFAGESEPQPDATLFLPPELGGRARIDEDDYIAGTPELVVEVAGSTAWYDTEEKLALYLEQGVLEYVIWRTEDNEIDWFRLTDGRYVRVAPDDAGVIESSVFPGLRLAVTALLAGDMARVTAELQTGLNSPAHAAFVERLKAATAT